MKVGDGTVPSEQASVYIVAFLVGAFLKVAGVLGTQKPLIWQSAVLSGLSSQENSSGPHPKMHVPSLKKSRLCPRLLPADPLSTHSCMCLRLHRTARRLTVNPKPADAPPTLPPPPPSPVAGLSREKRAITAQFGTVSLTGAEFECRDEESAERWC